MNTADESLLEQYNKAMTLHPDIEIKGKSVPYTSVNGHMFSQLSKSGTVGLRLPKEERERFLKKYRTTLFESYGAVMKDYVTVPNDLLNNRTEFKQYVNLSYHYVKGLKPKSTKAK